MPSNAPSSHAVAHEPFDKTTGVPKAVAKLWMGLALVGVIYPDIAMKACSVSFEEMTEQQGHLLKVMTKLGFVQIIFVAALQAAATEGGSSLQANTRKGVMRALNFTNACWCAVTCLWTWVFASPALSSQGWGTSVPTALSFCLAGVGAACYSASKGEEKSMLGGMLKFKLHSNTEDLEVPPFSKQNMVFLYWMGVSALAAVLMVLVPELFLKAHVGDALADDMVQWCKLGLQLLGLFYGLACVSLNLLVSSHLGSVLYHAVRGLFAAGLVVLVAVACFNDELELLGFSGKMVTFDVAVLAALVVMAAGCMKAHFSQVVRTK